MADQNQGTEKTSNISDERRRQMEDEIAKDIERKQEAANAARKAEYCKRKAKELTDAAKAAGDPDERQKLLNEALEKEVEAETFGKTAKWLQTGAFQGMVAGTGLGAGIGLWLGAVTGTIVGGTTGTITGGIGAGVGLGIGAIHGPWFKVGNLMGDTIRKITGDIPGWKATKKQKETLEDMINGVSKAEIPDEAELKAMQAAGAAVEKETHAKRQAASSNMPSASSMPSMPSMPGGESNVSDQKSVQKKSKPGREQNRESSKKVQEPAEGRARKQAQPSQSQNGNAQPQAGQAAAPSHVQKSSKRFAPSANDAQENGTPQKPSTSTSQTEKSNTRARPSAPSRKSTRKDSTVTSDPATATGDKAVNTGVVSKKKPRKLEVRSAKPKPKPSSSPGTKRTAQRPSG